MKKKPYTEFDRVSALYRKCRAYLLEYLMSQPSTPTPKQAAEHLILTKETMHAFARCVVNGNPESMFASMDIPKYMFKDKDPDPSDYIYLLNSKFDTYFITKAVAMIVDPVTREFCFVYWDGGGLPSNPYENFSEAITGSIAYMKQL